MTARGGVWLIDGSAGAEGALIAAAALTAGLDVTLVERDQPSADKAAAGIGRMLEGAVKRGKLAADARERMLAQAFRAVASYDALGDVDLVIEAVFESLEVKQEVFRTLDRICRPGAVLATNTSYLDVNLIAGATARPQDVIGLHFFSPANVMRLMEIVVADRTAPDVVATAFNLAKRMGKIGVRAGVCDGFIGNRMLMPRQDNAIALLIEGATPEQVDRVHTTFGMPMGPFQMSDLAGVDIGWHRDETRIETLQDALCAKGRWGQKTQAGFYDYDANRKHSPSAIVAEIVAEQRRKAGIAPRQISEDEIVVRTLYTMVNEGAKILDEGIAQRSSDIDVVWVNGYGWPRHKGGPMFWGDQIGAAPIVTALERYADRLGAGFTLSPLLVSLAANGGVLGG